MLSEFCLDKKTGVGERGLHGDGLFVVVISVIKKIDLLNRTEKE